MSDASNTIPVYQFQIFLLRISPMIWRRVQLRPDQTLADLHHAIQLGFSWSGESLHQFRRRGKNYCVPNDCTWGLDACATKLSAMGLTRGERFTYTYNFNSWWLHQVRFEGCVTAPQTTHFPRCVGGARKAPLELYRGAEHFNELSAVNTPYNLLRQIDELDLPELIENFTGAAIEDFHEEHPPRELKEIIYTWKPNLRRLHHLMHRSI